MKNIRTRHTTTKIQRNHTQHKAQQINTKLQNSDKKYLVPSLSFKINENRIEDLPSPPELGENTEEILNEFGFSKLEILDLYIKKIAY